MSIYRKTRVFFFFFFFCFFCLFFFVFFFLFFLSLKATTQCCCYPPRCHTGTEFYSHDGRAGKGWFKAWHLSLHFRKQWDVAIKYSFYLVRTVTHRFLYLSFYHYCSQTNLIISCTISVLQDELPRGNFVSPVNVLLMNLMEHIRAQEISHYQRKIKPETSSTRG